jgi:hypothetical protein
MLRAAGKPMKGMGDHVLVVFDIGTMRAMLGQMADVTLKTR